MPNYDWTCFRCEQINLAGSESCVHCGSPANIKAMTLLQDKNTDQSDKDLSASYPVSAWGWFSVFAFGVLLIIGGAMSVMSGYWPAFMPLMLDLLEQLSGRAGPVVAGLVAIFFGLGCVVICVVSFVRDSK